MGLEGQAPSRGLKRGHVLDAAGQRAISPDEAAQAAAGAYRDAVLALLALSAQPGVAVDGAAVQRAACRLQQQACAVLQARHARELPPGAALRQCLVELQGMRCAGGLLEGNGRGGSTAQAQEAAAARDEL